MKQRVVFLFYHGFGHLAAVFKIAHILENANYEVHFAGVEYFKNFVSSQGFKFYTLKSVPFGYGFEKWINTVRKKKYIAISALRARAADRLYEDRKVDFFWMLEELKPTIIFIDSRQATDFIILYSFLKERQIKVGIIQVMLPMDIVPGHPPINSDVFPCDAIAVSNAIRLMKVKQYKARIKKKIKFLGYDDHYIINRRIKKNEIPVHYVSRCGSLLNFSLKNVDEFIVAPREFDFPEFTPAPAQHFIGFMTNEIRRDQVEAEYKEVSQNIFELRRSKHLKLIYCSFGTLEPKGKENIFLFLKKLTRVASSANHILLVALKTGHAERQTLKLAEHVYIFNMVPQLEVLQHSDVFITHGGMNSIKEAIHAEVPLLVYPVHPEFDPIGNAARVAYHKLGLRGKADEDSEDEIQSKIKVLLEDPLYKKNVQALKKKDGLYTADKFLDKINSLTNLKI